MKFRKKPVVINAIQWTGDNFGEIQTFTSGKCWKTHETPSDTNLIIPTLEGNHTAKSGDWIIRGIVGEYYPCKLDIFEQTYDLVI